MDGKQSKNESIYMAKLAEQTERFDDMVQYMKLVIEASKELDQQQRNLLSVAYKNCVGAKRTAWRAITAYQLKQKPKGNAQYLQTIKEYRQKIEVELENKCYEILEIIDQKLLPPIKEGNTAPKNQAKIFYFQMRGDYNRYLAEFQTSEKKDEAIKQAEISYDQALKQINDSKLAQTDPLRLGVILNKSVFFYEIVNDLQKACQIAEAGNQEALENLGELETNEFKDATTIMQLITDNLTVWNAERKEQNKMHDQK